VGAGLLGLLFLPIMEHPYAAAYEPWIAVGWALASLLGGFGAAAAGAAQTGAAKWRGRLWMLVALSVLAGISLVVFTDLLCRNGYVIEDGSCAWE